MIAQTNWENVIVALIAGIPAMLAALTTLILTLRGQGQIKRVVKQEGLKNALVAQEVKETTAIAAAEVKTTLQEAVHKREMLGQEQNAKLDNLIKTTDTVKTLVNGNLTEILRTSTEALIKATEIKQTTPTLPLPQEIKLSADSEITVVSKD